jgi:hypothetical protein
VRSIYDIRNRWYVNALGSGQQLQNPSFESTRRDGEDVELQLFEVDDATGTFLVRQAPANFEMRFTAKRALNWGGPAVVYEPVWSWVPQAAVYRGSPRFDTDELTAMFVSASAVTRVTDDAEMIEQGIAMAFVENNHTLVTADLGRLIALSAGADKTATVAPGLGAASESIYVLCASEEHKITLVQGAGVTITPDTGLTMEITTGVVLQLLRTGANAWRLRVPDELASVTLMAEWTWRDLDVPGSLPTSTKRAEWIVHNDVNRGNEAAPRAPGAITEYITSLEVEANYVKATEPQSFNSDQKAQARTNIGAIGDTEVVKHVAQTLSPDQSAQARSNIGAASQSALDTTNSTASALATTVSGKASDATVTALAGTVATLSGNALKKTDTSLSDEDRALFRSNIGAMATNAAAVRTRLAATWNAAGNGTTVHLNGLMNTTQGTGTARNVVLLGTGITITSISGSTITSAGHGRTNGEWVQFTATTFPAPLVVGDWYCVRDATTNTFAVSATAGGAAITLSGAISVLKVLPPARAFYRLRRIGYVSVATAGGTCGTRHAALQWARSVDPALGGWTYSARFGISDAAAVANARMFVGMAARPSAGSLPNANPSTNANIIGIGADTGDTNLSIMHNDSSGTATKVALGASFPANTRNTDAYELQLICNADLSITYKVKNLISGASASGNLATDLPLAELELLAPQIWRNNGTTALAVAIDILDQQITQAA